MPAPTEWSTISIPGASSDVSDAAALDAIVQLTPAAAINATLGISAVVPPSANALARWNSTEQYLQTRPTGNTLTLLMAVLQNDSGVAWSRLALVYDLNSFSFVPEQLPGHRVYYSLTGEPNSWQVIPELTGVDTPGRLRAILTFGSWPAGGLLFLLWADDNGLAPSTDTSFTIDNFEVLPADQLPLITLQPQDQIACLGGTATFLVGATGPAPLEYQWRHYGEIIAGATNDTFAVTDVQFSDAGRYEVVVSNSFGAVNSAAATLTIGCSLTLSVVGDGTLTASPDQPFYAFGVPVFLTATASRWHAFNGWSDGPAENPRLVTIGLSNSYTATFAPTTAVETLTFGNVSRLAPVGMPAMFVDDEFIVTDSLTRTGAVGVLMLTTYPNGAVFYTLDGSTPSFFSSAYIGPFMLGRSATIRAVAFDAFFAQSWEADPVHVVIIPENALNLFTRGGGTVDLSPAGGPFPSNSVVSLSATAAAGWSFLQWLGDVVGTDANASVLMNRERCVEAVFGTTFSNAVSRAGTVVVEPVAGFYPYGTQVRLTAVPQAGHTFAVWGNVASGTNNPLTFVVTNAAPVVSAAFGPLNAGQAALSVVPWGGGRVNVSPRANRYAIGTTVTLTALPETGQSFLGWSGDASGTNTPLVVTMSTSRVITADFTQRPRLAVLTCHGPPEPGLIPLLLSGEFGGVFVIERSAGLQEWSPVATVTNVFGTVQFNDSFLTDGTGRFYRARALP